MKKTTCGWRWLPSPLWHRVLTEMHAAQTFNQSLTICIFYRPMQSS